MQQMFKDVSAVNEELMSTGAWVFGGGLHPKESATVVTATPGGDVVNEELKQTGAWVFAGGLHPATLATVVRENAGEVLLTDGPFVETKEQLGGFWVIEAADLDAALAWARKATVACQAPVEVRPFQDEPEQ